MNKMPLIRDYMATPALTLKPDQSIYEAMEFFLDHKISGAPVVDDDNKILGVISEKDCLKLVAKDTDHHPWDVNVADFMTKKVICILPDMDIYYAAGIFLNNVYRRLPVVENDKVIGQLSRRDVLRAIKDNIVKTDNLITHIN